ncbi:preprotein translocase, secg subunit [Flammeovirgaceae bacterium 311]|nr:preprotein translocase, secg subunit [Flammeovirgaceae bacterium 311]
MTLVISLIVIICLLLVLVVLAQNSKGGGLSSQFGGGGASQMIGVKRTGDLLEKVTWGLAIALLALSLVTNILLADNQPEGPVSPNIQRAQETIIPPVGGGLEGLGGEQGETAAPAAGDTAQ